MYRKALCAFAMTLCVLSVTSCQSARDMKEDAAKDPLHDEQARSATSAEHSAEDADWVKAHEQEDAAEDEEEAKKRSQLNVSVKPEDLAHDTDYGEPEPKLPNMFEQKDREKSVSMGGRILRDEEEQKLKDSIQGAELQLEVKTN